MHGGSETSETGALTDDPTRQIDGLRVGPNDSHSAEPRSVAAHSARLGRRVTAAPANSEQAAEGASAGWVTGFPPWHQGWVQSGQEAARDLSGRNHCCTRGSYSADRIQH